MGYARVDFCPIDADTEAPLWPVTLKVLNTERTAIVTEVTSNEAGIASALLPVGEYVVRAFHFGTAFEGERAFVVLEETTPIPAVPLNRFYIKGRRCSARHSLDARLCVASGYFRKADGSPADELDLRFSSEFAPVLVDGAAMTGVTTFTRTNKQGWAFVSLLRGAIYQGFIEGLETLERRLFVPDAPSWNLPDLFFPRALKLILPPDFTGITLAVGEEKLFDIKVLSSDGRVSEYLWDDVDWKCGDHRVVAFEHRGGQLWARGVGIGSTSIEVTRKSTSVYSVPERPIVGSPIEVTVTA